MAQVLQLRRGTTAQNNIFTGAAGEVTVDTDRESLRIHDGVTVGGKEIADLATAIPLLTDATTVGATDELIIQQGGITKRATATELFSSAAINDGIRNQLGINVVGNNQEFSQNNAIVHRLPDKVFVGGAAAHDNRFPPITKDWQGDYAATLTPVRILGGVSNASLTSGSAVVTFASPAYVAVSGISISSGVATVTATSHGYSTSNRITISGATPAGLNGTHTITVTDVNTFTFPTTQTGTVTGTIRSVLFPGVVPVAGFYISGEGVADGAKILSVDSPTQITLDANATATVATSTLSSYDLTEKYAGTAIGNLRSLTNTSGGNACAGFFGAQSANFSSSTASCLPLFSFALNNRATSSAGAWAAYLEAFRLNSHNAAARGAEITVCSTISGQEIKPTPFQQTATSCLQLAAGCGLAHELPSGPQKNIGCAIQVCESPMKFRVGINFLHQSIEGTDGYGGSGSAIRMSGGHMIEWLNPSDALVGRIFATTGLSSTQKSEIRFTTTGISFFGGNNQLIAAFENSSSSVNYIGLSPTNTSVPPLINALGSDTNIDLRLNPKGTGNVRFGTHAARSAITKPTGGGTQDAEARTAINALIDIIADGSAAGHITIKDSSGNTRKIAVVA